MRVGRLPQAARSVCLACFDPAGKLVWSLARGLVSSPSDLRPSAAERAVMHRMRRGCSIAGFLVWIVLCSQYCKAQYSADFQTNLISGVISNWSGNYVVGSNSFADALSIQANGALSSATGYV